MGYFYVEPASNCAYLTELVSVLIHSVFSIRATSTFASVATHKFMLKSIIVKYKEMFCSILMFKNTYFKYKYIFVKKYS